MARDDFNAKTKDILGKRVGFLCSNPACRANTIGPNSNPNKATIIGEAAHITAASQKGPRFDETMDPLQRQNIANGIWLCSKCADLIDKDEALYTVPLLQEWRENAEREMTLRINGVIEEKVSPNLDIDIVWQLGGRSPNGHSPKNEYEFLKEENAYLLKTFPPIIFWRIFWNFKLAIYNNSTIPIFNLQVEQKGDIQFGGLTFPPKKNNLPPLDNIDLEAKSYQFLEGTHVEADAVMKRKVPTHLEGLQLYLTYQDDKRNNYLDIFEIRQSEFIRVSHSS